VPRIVAEGFVIRVYSDDHAPAHVHVFPDGAELRVYLRGSRTPEDVAPDEGFESASCDPARRRASTPAPCHVAEVPLVKNPLRVASAKVVLGDPSRLVLRLRGKDDVELSFPLSRIDSFRRRVEPRRALAEGSNAHKVVVVKDDGGTIEWPALEVSFSVAELLPEFLGFGSAVRSAAARKAGTVRTTAKARSSRENGKRGGRPRKAA